MNDPLEFVPGYISPLTDKQHAALGRIAILWGQIEHFVDSLIPIISNLNWEQLDALQVRSKTISSKTDFLVASTSKMPDSKLKDDIRLFCAMIHETKGPRNHAFHGMWGFRAESRKERVFAASRKETDPRSPFPASGLPNLEKKMCKCSRMGMDIIAKLWGAPGRPEMSRFFHHGEPIEAPQWLRQWSERNPLDDGDLDRNAKAGQLPRLSAPYPQK